MVCGEALKDSHLCLDQMVESDSRKRGWWVVQEKAPSPKRVDGACLPRATKTGDRGS